MGFDVADRVGQYPFKVFFLFIIEVEIITFELLDITYFSPLETVWNGDIIKTKYSKPNFHFLKSL